LVCVDDVNLVGKNIKDHEKYTEPNVRYEVLTAMKMSMFVFWVVTPCGLVSRFQRFGETHFSPEDGDSTFPRNVFICLQVHTALQLRKPTSTEINKTTVRRQI
jgi:hypothetical protein